MENTLLPNVMTPLHQVKVLYNLKRESIKDIDSLYTLSEYIPVQLVRRIRCSNNTYIELVNDDPMGYMSKAKDIKQTYSLFKNDHI